MQHINFIVFCVFGVFGLNNGLLNPYTTTPVTTSPIPNEFDPEEMKYLHQLLNQESLMRMQLESQNLALQNSMAAISAKQTEQESEIHSLKTELAQYKTEVEMARNTTNTVLHLLEKVHHQPSVVAFTATMTHNLVNAGRGRIIVFDKVINNLGGDYDNNTGIFTVPISGVYQFTLTLSSDVNNAHGNILVNGNPIAHLFADKPALWGRGTIILNTRLQQGDRVWVIEPDNGSSTIVGMYSNMPVSIFSGHLIGSDYA